MIIRCKLYKEKEIFVCKRPSGQQNKTGKRNDGINCHNMPNHIHLIWETNKPNGKEMPYQSFLKFTGHQFKQILTSKHPAMLPDFKVEAVNRQYQFWQRDSLAFPLFSKAVINQKIDYIHLNPVSGKWQLAGFSVGYRFSSANFYDHEVAAKLKRHRRVWDSNIHWSAV